MPTSAQQTFIDDVARYVAKYAPQYGIRVNSPIIAQAILESGWGTSDLAQHHNYFGLKCRATWTGAVYSKVTREEYTPGTITNITADFRAYPSREAGIKGYFEFLFEAGIIRYDNLKGVTDPNKYIELIKADGYATSSTYVQQLKSLIAQYDLTKYDPKEGGNQMPKLFIVCGHGGGDPGASGNGYSEAERVRALAAEMKRQAGSQVTVGDTTIDWYSARKFANFANPGCPVVELHMDSAGASARGGHVIIKKGLAPDRYDTALANYIRSVFPGRASNPDGRDNLYNVNTCAKRGINYRLLEVCFITNKSDIDYFNSHIPEIAKGILACFDINSNSGNTNPSTGGHDDMAITDQDIARIWQYHYAGDKGEENCYTKLAMANHYAQQAYKQVTRTDDPTGRGVEMTDHDQIKWMAKAQQETLAAVRETNDLLKQLLAKM